ncbi:hypothetical protein RF11_02039 [Thelohanellus kitauei]|uniref:Uncharacterized protein n=1 Tax=Thelohanellus kitauei TaxID=669202 RepID=A0A0C2MLF2_THEKT|nr:hypothetical protein RF11_02039 [Thelohanellus kitauei]
MACSEMGDNISNYDQRGAQIYRKNFSDLTNHDRDEETYENSRIQSRFFRNSINSGDDASNDEAESVETLRAAEDAIPVIMYTDLRRHMMLMEGWSKKLVKINQRSNEHIDFDIDEDC